MPIPAILLPRLCGGGGNSVCTAASCTSMNGSLPVWLGAATIESFSAIRTRLRHDPDASVSFRCLTGAAGTASPTGAYRPAVRPVVCGVGRVDGVHGRLGLVVRKRSRSCLRVGALLPGGERVACGMAQRRPPGRDPGRAGLRGSDSRSREFTSVPGTPVLGAAGRRRGTGPAGFQRQAGGSGEFPRTCRTPGTGGGT